MELRRRRYLALTASLVGSAIAGCIGDDSDEPTPDQPTPSPSPTPTATPSSSPTPTPDPGPTTDHPLAVVHPPLEEWEGYDPDWSPPTDLPDVEDVGIQTLVENLEIPWDLEVAPNGDIFVTERPGGLTRYPAGLLTDLAEDDAVLDHASAVEAGDLDHWAFDFFEHLGCAVHPRYPDVQVVYNYCCIEHDADEEDYECRLFAHNLETDESVAMLEGIPGFTTHNGARLAFGPRNYLWVTMGDAQRVQQAADPSNLVGTTFRIGPTGSVPDDHPVVDTGHDLVYSYGHRNHQGLDFLPTGEAIIAEHGPVARDEVMIVRPGDNHGWPTIRGVPDDGEYESYADHDDVARPLINTGPDETWAPSGGTVYRGDRYATWRDRFFVAALRGERLYIVSLHPRGDAPDAHAVYSGEWSDATYDATAVDVLSSAVGRIRHVEEGPAGELYLLTSNRDERAPIRDGDDRIALITQG